ncbi:hypothetical protein PQR15_28665 [Streptomyces lydicus]|nr:hypothetical protein [Streptomyces lydicus]
MTEEPWPPAAAQVPEEPAPERPRITEEPSRTPDGDGTGIAPEPAPAPDLEPLPDVEELR